MIEGFRLNLRTEILNSPSLPRDMRMPTSNFFQGCSKSLTFVTLTSFQNLNTVSMLNWFFLANKPKDFPNIYWPLEWNVKLLEIVQLLFFKDWWLKKNRLLIYRSCLLIKQIKNLNRQLGKKILPLTQRHTEIIQICAILLMWC